MPLAGGVRTLARAAELLAASFEGSLDLPEALQAVGSERLQDPPSSSRWLRSLLNETIPPVRMGQLPRHGCEAG